MNKLIAAFTLIFMLAFNASAAEEKPKEACAVSSPVAGTTVIACPTYILTRDPDGTTICRIIPSNPNVFCSKVEVK